MFCKNCGNNVPDGEKFCPNCGTPVGGASAAPTAKASSGGISPTAVLWMGIGSLILGIGGAIMFGTIAALIGLALGIVGLVFGIKIRKETNNQEGTAAFVLSLLGIIFAALFAIACTACSSCTCGYGKWGCIGSKCMMKNDVDNTVENIQQQLDNIDYDQLNEELNNMFNTQ